MFLEAPQAPAPTPVGQQTQGGDVVPLPEGKGRDTAVRLCSNCHRIDRWDKERHSAEKWSDIVDDMVSKGLNASDDDLSIVNDYLAKYLAPLPKAPAPPPQSDKPPQ
jgi:hypothetical protein